MSPASETVKKHVPLDQIVENAAIQVRVKIDLNRVHEYETVIQECGQMDPLIVYRNREAKAGEPLYVLSSGHHRIRAYRNCGKKTAPCEIRDGSLSQALECAIESNIKHGLPMTRADKRKAAGMAVLDPVLGNRTDAQIARLICVSPSFVNEVRRGVRPQDKKKPSAPASNGTAASGKRESESPAPPTATARQRKEVADPRPTKAAALREIEKRVDDEIVDEQDVVKLFDSPKGAYVWAAKTGSNVRLKIVNRVGRVLFENDVVLKEINEQELVLKAEGLREISCEGV